MGNILFLDNEKYLYATFADYLENSKSLPGMHFLCKRIDEWKAEVVAIRDDGKFQCFRVYGVDNPVLYIKARIYTEELWGLQPREWIVYDEEPPHAEKFIIRKTKEGNLFDL